MFFKRKGNRDEAGGTAVAERPSLSDAGTREEILAEIAELTAANRADRDREIERRLMRLRHLAGIRSQVPVDVPPQHVEAADDRLPALTASLPEFTRDELTPGLLRAAILRDGCVLVRGLVEREDALAFADQIDRAFEERERHDQGLGAAEGYYEEFQPTEHFEIAAHRPWIKEGGGVLAADSPMLTFEMMELFGAAALPGLVDGYLGEPAMISVHKTTLRKADPSVGGAWHQDGKFMGDVRALNLWLSLSRCGDESPGLDIVPRRLDHLVAAQTDEAVLDFQVSRKQAEQAAGDRPIVRPIFEPGDALLFDDLFLHSTGSDPSMPKPRYAVESWFFGASAFPSDYAPIAV